MSLFITIEGIEGSGKSTVSSTLANNLQAVGQEVICTREPGGTELGREIRALLLGTNTGISSLAEVLLFAADRAEHIEKLISPLLSANKTVICNRYIHSTLAYQGYGRGLDLETLWALSKIATNGIMPNKVILLDLDETTGLQRARKRSSEENSVESSWNRFEEEELAFHKRIRNGYLEMAKQDPERFIIIDAQQDQEKVLSSVTVALKDLII